MKTMNKILGMALLSLSLVPFASCTDDNDWDVDSSHDRLFGVNREDLTLSEGDTWVEVSFTGMRGTEYYIIEVSTDSLTDEMGMGASPNSIVYGEDMSITASPDTIRGLTGDTKYYLRMKAMSSQTKESRWVYFDNGDGGTSFRTLAEQIFIESEILRGDTYMELKWTPGAEVTNIIVTPSDGSEPMNIDLRNNADAIANGEYRVEGLTPSTTYTFEIYNEDTRRGTLTLATMASMPSADYLYPLPSTVTVISQSLLDDIAAEAIAQSGNADNYSVTIGIPAGSTISMYGTDEETGEQTNVTIPDGMSVTFFGIAGGETPTLNMDKGIDIGGSHAYIRFDNVRLVDTGCQYFINQSDACTIGGDLSFSNCTMTDFERSIIRMQSDAAKSINEVNIDNCVMTNMSYGNGYSVLYWNNAAYTVGTVNITNTTFDTFARSFLEVTNSNTGTINISNSTFYNGPASGRYFIDANNCAQADVNLTRCIFALSPDPTNCRGIRTPNGNVVINEVYFTNDFVLTSNAFEPTTQLELSSTQLFLNPAEHDFTIQERGIEAGDPRWY